MPVNSILKGFEGPTWNLARWACEQDDTSLIEQAISNCSEEDDHKGLLQYSCRHAIKNNAENVLEYLIDKAGLHVRTLPPMVVAGDGRSKAILEILLAHGWDINWRNTSTSDPNAEPFMWHIVKDGDMVAWCLKHGASVFAKDQEPLKKDRLSQSQLCCRTVLECAATNASITTFELLRSKGAPLGWRPLHLAVKAAAAHARPDDEKSKDAGTQSSNLTRSDERINMVRHLIDVVGLDVNALDRPVGKRRPDGWGTPICYIANLDGLEHTRQLTWLLLDRGADPAPGLEEAELSGHETFAGDVEAWKAQPNHLKKKKGNSGGKCNVQ
ncbi:hypothetical protein K504DRAFT_387178 [Pleomassaria siparia CBS 279.74]|uniref:Ankyrin n=1 Tax=Pleomassaria siparia CBS 279.74 TaxID=1314801 RepID=A0A6G1JYU3_9PLEO|nr:hypothetical protein K504DRAFT_387178 [Pleomassaria siparia CBS 279.74]